MNKLSAVYIHAALSYHYRNIAMAQAQGSNAPPLSAEQLRELLSAKPTRYEFGASQSKAERAVSISQMPHTDQAAMLAALQLIITKAGFEFDESATLLYHMITGDDEELDADIERQYSPDWSLAVYAGDNKALYDFNGWPGDNEDGVGLYRRELAPGCNKLELIFTNGDQILEAKWPQHAAVIEEFSELRLRSPPASQD